MRDGNKTGNTYYLYNALGQRVSKERTGAGRDHDESHGHARYIYDLQGNLIAEATDGQSTKNYVYIDGLPVAVMDGGQIHYIHTNHLGAPQKMTDDRQQIAWHRVAKPFGETFAINGNANLNLRFPGQYHDAETGLDYNFFRSYDPALGRYTQSDPIGLLGGINTFGYAGQNPVNLIDPSGLCFLNLFNQGALAGFAGGGSDALLNALANGSTADQIASWLGFTVGYGNSAIYTTAAGLTGGAVVGGVYRAVTTTRVGRWMSTQEFSTMSNTGKVVEGAGGRTYVVNPPNPAAYNSASPGSVYAEFNVPKNSLFPASKPEWSVIPGPNVSTGLYGTPPASMPPATCIICVIGGK